MRRIPPLASPFQKASPATRLADSATAAMPDETPSPVAPASDTATSAVSPRQAGSGRSAGFSSGFSAPPQGGPGLRRAATDSLAGDDGAAARRVRPSANIHPQQPQLHGAESPFAFSPEPPPRRSSNFSEYSLGDARDLINPQPREGGQFSMTNESSSLASLSLAFALLPALAGVLFKNGSAVVTDVMLLGLAGVFLHWSVTQPWSWYHSAQEVRIRYDAATDIAVEDDSDLESTHHAPLDHVPEDEAVQTERQQSTSDQKRPTATQNSALAELYLYEILALLSCFLLPIIGAYMLHAIRSQLSRPSEGLVSNYNLTIFLLMSELRVFSHMIKLLQSRTLHLQRVVQGDPADSQQTYGAGQLEAVFMRLDQLETRLSGGDTAGARDNRTKPDSARAKQDAAVARDVRNAIQPELDAISRAVRRYEKKATLLQFQTDARFAGVEARLDDAIALAASAVKNTASHNNIFLWAVESLTAIILLPFKALVRLLLLPLSTLLSLTNKNSKKKGGAPSKSSRGGGGRSKQMGLPPQRFTGDRVPSRVSKR